MPTWQTVCTVGTLRAYMAYKIILKNFNQHEKLATSTFILNYDFLRKKIINEINKKIYKNHTSFLFLAMKHNTNIGKNLNTTILRWVYFSIEMVGFDFFQSLLSLGNTENQTKKKEPRSRSQNLNHIDHKSSKCADQK